MDTIYSAIDMGDKNLLTLEFRKLFSDLDIREDQLLQILEIFPILTEKFTTSSTVPLVKEVIIWYAYEGIIWGIGEDFRQVMLRNKKLRYNDAIFHAVEKIVLKKAYGKGRQSFVMLIGHYGINSNIPILRELLNDPDVGGHAVYALRKRRALDAEADIRPFLNHKSTWIRNEAKKYFKTVVDNKGEGSTH